MADVPSDCDPLGRAVFSLGLSFSLNLFLPSSKTVLEPLLLPLLCSDLGHFFFFTWTLFCHQTPSPQLLLTPFVTGQHSVISESRPFPV